MDILSEGPFTVFIGLDWADTKHDICWQAADSDRREFGRIAHTVSSIDDWAREMHQRYGGRIAIALEASRGPIVYALQKYDFLVLFPINPSSLASYRKTFAPSRAKDDPTDAELALDFMVRHPEQCRPLKPQSPKIRELSFLVEQRRQLVNDRVRLSNRLVNALKQYYPQALEWFASHDTVLFCDFLERWPTPLQARRARRATLKKFFWAHNCRRSAIMEARVEAIKVTQLMTHDIAVINAHSLQVQLLAEQLRGLVKAIERYDATIAALAPLHPDYALFSVLPGAGQALAPRLLVAFGEHRDRFGSAAEVQMYVGVAPVTERSGKKCWIHWRLRCPTFLRQSFVEWAGKTISSSYWAGAYYRQQRAKGSDHQSAVRALAFKWIRILYRCWKTRTPYDETKYLKALKRRGSSLVKLLGEVDVSAEAIA
jgi:transposase